MRDAMYVCWTKFKLFKTRSKPNSNAAGTARNIGDGVGFLFGDRTATAPPRIALDSDFETRVSGTAAEPVFEKQFGL